MRADFSKPMPWILAGIAVGASQAIHLGYTPDSMQYVDIAANFIQGLGLSAYDLTVFAKAVPDPALLWPPLYPICLGLVAKTGVGLGIAPNVLHFVTFMAGLTLVFAMGRRAGGALVGTLSLMVWLFISPHITIWTYAWSESLFVVLTAAFILTMGIALDRGSCVPALFVAGVLGGLATLCRYAGLACAIAGFAAIAFVFYSAKPKGRLSKALQALVVFAAGFILILLPWLIENVRTSGHLLGPPRPEAAQSLAENVARLISTAGLDLMLPLGIMAALLLFSGFESRIGWARLRAILIPENRPLVSVCTLWCVSYSAVLLVAASRYDLDRIGSRLASPLCVPLIVLMIRAGHVAYASRHNNGLRLSQQVLKLFLVVLLAMAAGEAGIDLNRRARDKVFHEHEVEWIAETTPPHSLFIGQGIWWVRFKTGRPVLSTSAAYGSELYPERVSPFLDKFGHDFSRVYLLIEDMCRTDRDLVDRYLKAGYSLERQETTGFTVYEISGW